MYVRNFLIKAIYMSLFVELIATTSLKADDDPSKIGFGLSITRPFADLKRVTSSGYGF